MRSTPTPGTPDKNTSPEYRHSDGVLYHFTHRHRSGLFFHSILFIICSWGFPVTMDGRSLFSLLSALLVVGFMIVEPFSRGLLIVGILMLATAGIVDLLDFRAE